MNPEAGCFFTGVTLDHSLRGARNQASRKKVAGHNITSQSDHITNSISPRFIVLICQKRRLLAEKLR